MKKNKEYIIAGSLLSLAIVGMVFAYNSESVTQKAEEQEEQKIAFQEVDDGEEEAKDEVEDVSNILAAKKEEEKEEEEKAEPEAEPIVEEKQEQPQTQETSSKPEALHFQETLIWPTEGNVIMNYSMDQTVYFASLDQYRYNPAVIIGAQVNNEVKAAAAGKVLDVFNNEETGCTVSIDVGDGYKAVYGQLKEVSKEIGDYVSAEEVIGYVNEPTKYYSEEGGNLYFQLLKDDKPVDPMNYFQ